YRIKTILGHDGHCAVSEGVAAQLEDVINYCVFALIKLESPLIPWNNEGREGREGREERGL
ncbi:MAG: nucleotide modification associated domain-containing protein, partial [Oscillospiraceae bacterium]